MTVSPPARCTADGQLAGATLSDHGEVIIGMLQDSFGSKSAAISQAASTAALAAAGVGFQDAGSDGYAMYCADRAAAGYASGMGEIFRTVAAVKPVEWAEPRQALEQTQGEGLQAGNTPASPAIRRHRVSGEAARGAATGTLLLALLALHVWN